MFHLHHEVHCSLFSNFGSIYIYIYISFYRHFFSFCKPFFSILQTFQSFLYSTSLFYDITFYKVLNKCLGKIPICVTCHVLGSYCQTHFTSLIYIRIYFIIYKKSYTKWYMHKNLNKTKN